MLMTRQAPIVHVAAGALASAALLGAVQREVQWEFVARDKHGRVKWRETFTNLVTNAGLDLENDVFLGATAKPTFYIGLIDGSPTIAATDTLGSHAGWSEVTAYDESARQAWTGGSSSGGVISNSASAAVFTVSTNGTTIGGAFLVTNSTKGGSTGTCYSAGAFSASDKTLDDGDTLTVTISQTVARAA